MEADDLQSAEEADSLLSEIEGAGLAVVDAELHEALVAFVRGLKWLDRCDLGDELGYLLAVEMVNEVHARAVALLAERGE